MHTDCLWPIDDFKVFGILICPLSQRSRSKILKLGMFGALHLLWSWFIFSTIIGHGMYMTMKDSSSLHGLRVKGQGQTFCLYGSK